MVRKLRTTESEEKHVVVVAAAVRVHPVIRRIGRVRVDVGATEPGTRRSLRAVPAIPLQRGEAIAVCIDEGPARVASGDPGREDRADEGEAHGLPGEMEPPQHSAGARGQRRGHPTTRRSQWPRADRAGPGRACPRPRGWPPPNACTR